jgi:hypothetical protein
MEEKGLAKQSWLKIRVGQKAFLFSCKGRIYRIGGRTV